MRSLQNFDKQFRERNPNCFKFPRKKNKQGSTLLVDGKVTSDPSSVLEAWSRHFNNLSSSYEDDYPALLEFNERIKELDRISTDYDQKDFILDTPFSREEVEGAVESLKLGKAGGFDGLLPEHLRYGGNFLILWIQQVCNSIVEFETVPAVLKVGVVCPVYKGQGKDPLNPNSYRGVTLTSVLNKTMERLFLNRLQSLLSDQQIPHKNQTGFRKKTSCSDAIFCTYEALSKYARAGDTAYICFYDLHKAFDTVQYSVLLSRAFDCGIVGRAWRLLRSWYSSSKCMVKVNGELSEEFCLERGVLQGSVLSPTLFLLVVDPLLKDLEKKCLGPDFNGLYAGAFAHADDIRTICTSRDTLEEQIVCIEKFMNDNALVLNASKCEVVVVSTGKAPPDHICTIANHPLVPCVSARCLGFWWAWDLSADKSVDVAIAKARRSFFAYGAMGAYHGKLNPLSGRAIFETCILPILMYGCENWFVSDAILKKLDSFQSEVGRRITCLSRHHSTRAVRLALDWPSMATRILLRKLNFLQRLLSNEESIAHNFFVNLSGQDAHLQLIEGCLFLEAQLGLEGIVEDVRKGNINASELKKVLLCKDREDLLSVAMEHQSTALAAQIASHTNWLKIWDCALDYGPRGTNAIQHFFKILTRPVLGPAPCPKCSINELDSSFFRHFITKHSPFEHEDDIVKLLCAPNLVICGIVDFFKSQRL